MLLVEFVHLHLKEVIVLSEVYLFGNHGSGWSCQSCDRTDTPACIQTLFVHVTCGCDTIQMFIPKSLDNTCDVICCISSTNTATRLQCVQLVSCVGRCQYPAETCVVSRETRVNRGLPSARQFLLQTSSILQLLGAWESASLDRISCFSEGLTV